MDSCFALRNPRIAQILTLRGTYIYHNNIIMARNFRGLKFSRTRPSLAGQRLLTQKARKGLLNEGTCACPPGMYIMS